jgi:hypothetical protein
MNLKALLCLAVVLASWTQAKPDFSGRWKVNIEETEFLGTKPSPASYSVVRTVEQKPRELRLKIEREVKGQKSGFNFVTIPIGGSEPHVSDEAGIIRARWNDETLHFDYLYNPGTERESERTEDWTMSSDGKKLTDREWVRRPDGRELRYTIVFDRQP